MILDNEYYMDQQRYTQANQFNVTKKLKNGIYLLETSVVKWFLE